MCTLSDLSSKPVTVLVVFHFLVLFPKNDAFDFLYNACHSISKVDTKMLVHLSLVQTKLIFIKGIAVPI